MWQSNNPCERIKNSLLIRKIEETLPKAPSFLQEANQPRGNPVNHQPIADGVHPE